MPLYNPAPYQDKFSTNYPIDINKTQMDVPLEQGSVGWNEQLNTSGSGTTNATAGTTEAITHGLGFVPNFVDITATSNGIVYLDKTNPATATTFNVLGSAASLTFDWAAQ